jgi:hypothetical protein
VSDDNHDEIIDLCPADRTGKRERPGDHHGLGGRRWGGRGPTPAARSRVLVPAALAVVIGAAGAALTAGVGKLVPREHRLVAGLVTTAAAGACVVAAVRGRHGGAISVMTYEHGLVYNRGGGPTIVRWASVTAVAEQRYTVVNTFGQPIGRGHALHLTCGDGDAHDLEVGGIDDSTALAGYIHEGTLEYLVPRAEAELAKNRAVAFGPLDVTPAGLICGRDVLPWGEMSSVEVLDGHLVVGRKRDPKPWYEGPTWAIPNLPLLLNLIEARFFGPRAGEKDKPGASRYSLLDRYQPATGAPRIGY